VKAAPFEYHAPETVADAVGVLARHGDEAKVIAGGQSLVPLLALRLARFEHLVDLGRIAALRGIENTNGGIRIGAMTTQAEIERDRDVQRRAPLVTAATRLIGHFQIRNRGTVGGSLAHADPAAEYPAVALVLDAELELTGPNGTRRVPASEFFVSTWTTVAEPDEVLVAVHVPPSPAHTGVAIEEVARRHGDFALAGVACAVTVENGAVTKAAVGLLGMGSTPLRPAAAEAALTGASAMPSAAELRELGRLAVDDLDPPGDLHATGAHRRRIAAHLVERTLTTAIEEATGA
jgi:carbon-monoxide dehydrogenase medium subunit